MCFGTVMLSTLQCAVHHCAVQHSARLSATSVFSVHSAFLPPPGIHQLGRSAALTRDGGRELEILHFSFVFCSKLKVAVILGKSSEKFKAILFLSLICELLVYLGEF